MRHSTRLLRQAGLISALACACMAQNTPGPAVPHIEMRTGQMSYFSLGAGPAAVSPFQAVTGAPYSAEEVNEHTQTLADGTNITQTNVQSKLYRDSEGRTRTERTISPPGGSGQTWAPSFVEIADPVAGYRYTLNERSHTASRMPWPPAGVRKFFAKAANGTANRSTSRTGAFAGIIPPPPPPPSSSLSGSSNGNGRPHPEMKTESLGTQTIEGVSATGTRTTTTFPEGFSGTTGRL